MKTVLFPKDVVGSINGWVSNDKVTVNLKPGESVELSDFNAADICSVFKFLQVEKTLEELQAQRKELETALKGTKKVSESKKAPVVKIDVKDEPEVEETVVAKEDELDKLDRKELIALAIKQGIRGNQRSEELKKQIRAKQV